MCRVSLGSPRSTATAIVKGMQCRCSSDAHVQFLRPGPGRFAAGAIKKTPLYKYLCMIVLTIVLLDLQFYIMNNDSFSTYSTLNAEWIKYLRIGIK